MSHMIIKWYNRDSISDVEMKQARLVSDRLSGKKKESPDGITIEQLQETYSKVKFSSLLPNEMVVRLINYGSRTATGINRMSESKRRK
jgi:hypothetical protein